MLSMGQKHFRRQVMRTTLNIDDQVSSLAKHRAIEQGITLTRIVENALHDTMFKKAEKNTSNYSKR